VADGLQKHGTLIARQAMRARRVTAGRQPTALPRQSPLRMSAPNTVARSPVAGSARCCPATSQVRAVWRRLVATARGVAQLSEGMSGSVRYGGSVCTLLRSTGMLPPCGRYVAPTRPICPQVTWRCRAAVDAVNAALFVTGASASRASIVDGSRMFHGRWRRRQQAAS